MIVGIHMIQRETGYLKGFKLCPNFGTKLTAGFRRKEVAKTGANQIIVENAI